MVRRDPGIDLGELVLRRRRRRVAVARRLRERGRTRAAAAVPQRARELELDLGHLDRPATGPADGERALECGLRLRELVAREPAAADLEERIADVGMVATERL